VGALQHRIIVVATSEGVAPDRAQAHWRDRHAEVYLPTPHLVGYVQNRPLPEEWSRLGLRSVCSETWFAGREEERASFASPYYRDTVMPDERRFLDRDSAWMGRVVAGEDAAGGRYRVLAFGTAELEIDCAVLEVDRDPWCGGARVVASAWLDDRDHAVEVARAAAGFAFAAEPAVLRAPPR
jgi:hypothetical protein